MKWKRTMKVIMLGLILSCVFNIGEPSKIFANGLVDQGVPNDIKLLHNLEENSGNKHKNSFNYYRLSVRFEAWTSDPNVQIKVPHKFEFYENDKLVNTVKFTNAGKDITTGAEAYIPDTLLLNRDKFYYRQYLVENKDKGTYMYEVKAYWGEGEGAVSRTDTLEVTVDTEAGMAETWIGTSDMFGSTRPQGNMAMYEDYTEEHDYLPKHIPGEQDGYTSPNLGQANEMMDKPLSGNKHYGNIPDGTKGISIHNAILESHVMYVGKQYNDKDKKKKVKFSIGNSGLEGNGQNVADCVEVKAISDILTELLYASQNPEEFPKGAYPKEKFGFYMGLGTGPLGSNKGKIGDTPGDHPNDLAYLFMNKNGEAHSQFYFKVTDEKGQPIEGFIFDYLKVTYNPILDGEIDNLDGGDGFVKPSGYMMLNSSFEVKEAAPGPKMTINMDGVLKGGLDQYMEFKETATTGANRHDKTLMKLYIAHVEGDGKYKLCNFSWDKGSEKIMNVEIPKEFLKDVGVGADKTTQFQPGSYKVKMHIPTSVKSGCKINKYNELVESGAIYPIQLKLNTYNPILVGRPELQKKQLRVDKTFKIKPYRMPGIN